MNIAYDGKEKLIIDGVEHKIDDIYAFDISTSEDTNHITIVKKNEEIKLLSYKNKEETVNELKNMFKAIRLADCSQFEILDSVIVNMDKINDVGYGKDFIMIEFDDRSFTKKIDKVSKSGFLKKYDNYFAVNQNNTIK